MGLLSDRVDLLIKRAMDGLSARQQVISNNIANVDTPGFKAGRVSFETSLRRALQGGTALSVTDPRHLQPPEYQPNPSVQVLNTVGRTDGNNVDIDLEMSQLAETSIRYSALVEVMGKRLASLRTVINEGRK
jgi:flagellar basal-body rod protein FlgB